MNAAAWISAALSDETPVCMGLKLRPYSIGHELLLTRHESAFIFGGPITLSELVLSVLICSQTLTEAQRSLSAWWTPLFVKCWGWRMRKMNIFQEANTFQAYRQSGDWQPDVNIELKNSRVMTAPKAVRLLAFLVVTCGMPQAEALDMPVARANALLYADLDSRGEVTFFSDSDAALFAKARELAETEQTQEKGVANGAL